jgi:uncharacterized protein (TIGR04255 family)
MPTTPRKLVKDAIAEALCEIRFECKESGTLPETVVSKLVEFEPWRSFQHVRLPLSDFPVSVRTQDPNLKYLPVIELREKSGPRVAKIGVNVLSFHHLPPYPGWNAFKPEIDIAIDHLFKSLPELRATRMGLRYINVFTKEDHGVSSVSDLKYSITVSGRALHEPQLLHYQIKRSDAHVVQVRIATPEFVTSSGGQKVDALVDLDVFTPNGWESTEVDVVHNCVRTLSSKAAMSLLQDSANSDSLLLR